MPGLTAQGALLRLRGALVGVLLVGLIGIYITPVVRKAHDGPFLTVTFFDVGQGDALFIESPTGTQILIDGGPDSTVLQDLSAALGFFDRTLDMVVATHPDADHVGGLPDVFARYDVARVLLTENTGESATADAFRERAHAEGAQVSIARRGMRYDIGGGAVLSVLFPDRDVAHLESNTSSIVLQLTYGDHEFLFTGDAPQSIEDYLVLMYGKQLASDVLKVGHHGSRTSTSDLFVATVMPSYAVISSGRDNSYGHPHHEVLETLERARVNIKNTAVEGSISFLSDGVRLRIK